MPQEVSAVFSHSATQAVRIFPMRSTLVLCFSLLSSYHVVGHKLRHKRTSRGNTSAFGLGEFDNIGNGLDDAHLSGLTDSIEGLFKSGGQDTEQQLHDDPHVAGLTSSIEGLFNSSRQESVDKPRALRARAAQQRNSSKLSIALPSKKASISSRSGSVSAPKSPAVSPRKADLHEATNIAHIAAQAAKILAHSAADEKKRATQHEAKFVHQVTSAIPAARKHEPLSNVTAKHKASDPKPVAKKTQHAPATVRKASPTSTKAKVSKPSNQKVTSSKAHASTPSVEKVVARSKKSSNSSEFSTRVAKKASALKNVSSESKSTNASKKASAPKSTPLDNSTANMSSIAEGAKNSAAKAKKGAIGTFAVDPASNPLRPKAPNISNATGNQNATVDSEVVQELPMASLALGDDYYASSSKNNASGNTSLKSNASSTTKGLASAGKGVAGSKNLAGNKSGWQEREKYLESQIAALKQKLEKQASESSKKSSSQTAGTPSKKVKSALETHASVFTGSVDSLASTSDGASASDDKSSASDSQSSEVDSQASVSDDSLASTSTVSFNIGEGGSALYFKQRPFAVGTFTQAPSDVVAHPWGSQSMSFWGWVSSFFGGPSTAATTTLSGGPDVRASSLLTVESQGYRQDAERTAKATADDSMHSVSLEDSFRDLQHQDEQQEEFLRHKDATARIVAGRAAAPHKPTKEELESRHQTDISSFWGSLEQEDQSIERSLSENGEDLEQYERLTKFQNERVSQAAADLEEDNLNFMAPHHLKKADKSFEATPIHDVFEHLEKHDQKTESQIKSNPDLQMIQLRHMRHNF